MKQNLYQSLITRLKEKHAKLATRFEQRVKSGTFQIQSGRKRKQTVERLKRVERQLKTLSTSHSEALSINYKHWALALTLGAVVTTASAQETQRRGFIDKLKARAADGKGTNFKGASNYQAKAQTIFFTESFLLGEGYPENVHLGDLDGDGDTDVLYSPYFGDPSILLNDGSANFIEATASIFSTEINFNSALGDFDGDGDLDFLSDIRQYGAALNPQVWTNDGSGNFTAQAATFPVGAKVYEIIAEDIDGDGDADIVYYGDNELGVLINTSFNFTAAPGAPLLGPYDTESRILNMIDIDGDTDLDIAYSGLDGSLNNGLRVFTNDGAGTFTDAGTHVITGNVEHAAVGDIDNDGDMDLFISQSANPNVDIIPMINDGAGNFTAQATVVVTNAENSDDIFSEDLNGDNFDDIILSTESKGTFVYQGDGVGGFTLGDSFAGGVFPGSLDGDGDIDFMVFDKDLSWIENQGAFTFVRDAGEILRITSSYDTDVVDIDGDGDLDVIPVGELSSRVWDNDGTAQDFVIAQDLGQDALAQMFGDLDGDMDPDMIRIPSVSGVDNEGFEVWINNAGTLSLNSTVGGTVFKTRYGELVDLDGDTDLDLVALTEIQGSSQYDIKTFLNQGSLTFVEQSSHTFNPSESPDKLSVGDIDGDSDIDVVVANEDYGMEVFVNDGAGNLTFDTNVVPLGANFQLTDVDLGDLDGDGDLDVFASNSDGDATASYVFENDGLGTFTDSGKNVAVTNAYSSGLGDLDGDGDLDIITGGELTAVKIWVNDGAANFSFDSDLGLISDEYIQFAFGDLDGDGDLDFATSGAYAPNKVFLNGAPDPLLADSVVLVSMFDNMNGDMWNDATNWKGGDLDTWFGVTVTSDRVTAIQLPDNNVQGTIPATVNQLDALETLDLSVNEIDAIGTNFSGLTSIQTLNLSDNNLDFDDLAGVAGVTGLVYDAQTPADIEVDELLAVGSPITFDFVIPGVNNEYQWYRDSTLLVDSVRNDIIIDQLRRDNMGEYYCLVENADVPGLTISSARKNVLASAIVNGKLLIDNSGTTASGGQVTLLEVTNTDGYDTTAVFDIAANGEYTFNDVVLSDYLLVGFPDTIQHVGSLPTYYDQTVFWAEADTIFLEDNFNTDIIAISQVNPGGGIGSFSGTLDEEVDEGGREMGKRRLGGAGVTARRGRRSGRFSGTGELAYYVFTDKDGNFLVSGMEPGEYNIEILYPGYPMDEDSFLDMTIGEGNNDKDVLVEAVVDKGVITVNQIILTGVDEFSQANVRAYPNPTRDAVFIEWEKDTNEVEVKVFDLIGNEVLVKHLTKQQNQLNTADLPKGQYILLIQTDKEVISKYKMMIMR